MKTWRQTENQIKKRAVRPDQTRQLSPEDVQAQIQMTAQTLYFIKIIVNHSLQNSVNQVMLKKRPDSHLIAPFSRWF